MQVVAHGVEQVGLAEPDAPVDEQGLNRYPGSRRRPWRPRPRARCWHPGRSSRSDSGPDAAGARTGPAGRGGARARPGGRRRRPRRSVSRCRHEVRAGCTSRTSTCTRAAGRRSPRGRRPGPGVVGQTLLDKTAGRSERHGALTLLDEANGPDGEVKGLRTDAGLKERERLGPGGGKGSGVHRSSGGEERTQRDEMIAKSGFFGQKNPRDSTGMAEQSPGAGEHTTSTK